MIVQGVNVKEFVPIINAGTYWDRQTLPQDRGGMAEASRSE
jgi:hypothetical protein